MTCVAHPSPKIEPVVFYNASTRISGLSQNAAFSLLTSWAIRLSGIPVVNFCCKAGMSRCVLGTDEADPFHPMPCGMCIRQSEANYIGSNTYWYKYHQDDSLSASLVNLNLSDLIKFEYPLPSSWSMDSRDSVAAQLNLPLGKIVLPSLQWRLRRRSLVDDEPTRFLCRQFILSAWNIANEFNLLMKSCKPLVVVLFNGMHFPEAVVYWLCQSQDVRVVTYESGFQPYSGYFVEGQATTYPITIPDGELTQLQNDRLDADLKKRWQGDFSMAGIKFWHGIHGISDSLEQKISSSKQTVVVFTNVIFDTTQLHANTAFNDMFDWLDNLIEVIRVHPETLFIIRAHPDEWRPGKVSRESVAMWFEQKGVSLMKNVVFIPPNEQVSSYDLIKVSKFILVYNSTISLEATLLGVPALCAARAPFTNFETVFYESERDAYIKRVEDFLKENRLEVPPDAIKRTRRFMYYRYFRFSLPFGEFIESTQPVGFVKMKKFSLLAIKQSPTLQTLVSGLRGENNFELDA